MCRQALHFSLSLLSSYIAHLKDNLQTRIKCLSIHPVELGSFLAQPNPRVSCAYSIHYEILDKTYVTMNFHTEKCIFSESIQYGRVSVLKMGSYLYFTDTGGLILPSPALCVVIFA